MRRIARFLARLLLLLAGAALLAALALFALSGYVLTYPYRRSSLRSAELQVGREFALALAGLVAILQARRSRAEG